MTTQHRFASLSLALILLGAGCSIGAQPAQNPTGGMWYSPDRGTSWKQITVLYTSDGVANWSNTDVITMQFDPNDSLALYAGTRDMGLMYSYDAGKTWMQPKDVASGPVQALAVNPKDKCTVFVARLSEIWKTEDCNRTYKRVFTPELGTDFIKTLVIDWYNPSIMYAVSQNGAFFKSTSGGANWASPTKFDNHVTSLVMDPNDSRVLFAGTEGAGVMKSSDAGATWVSLQEAAKTIDGSNQVKTIVAANGTKNMFIAAIGSGLMKTLDGGATWEALKTLTNPPQTNIVSVAIDPKNSNVIYYGTEAVFYRTATGGTSWETIKLPTARAAGTLLVHPDSSEAIYLGAKNLAK